MATGSGLDSQLGTKTETTVGTEATPVTQFFGFNSSDLAFDPSYIEGTSLMAGQRFKDIGSVGIARKSATGKIELDVMMKGFGWWLKHILGSNGSLANPTVITGTAYKQVHVPGGLRGLSFTAQLGKPEPGTGTVKPLTYYGCKVTDWNLTLADNAITMLDMTVDGWNEDNVASLAAATYPAGNQAFNFSHVNVFNVGGTPSTTAGVTTITGGTAVTSVVTKLTLSGKASLANARYGLGNAGVKREQLENDFFSLTGAFEGEYDSSVWDSPFRTGATTSIQCTSTGPIISGGNSYTLDIIIPAVKIDKAPAAISGPDLVSVSGEFTVYSNGVDPAMQITIVSTDSVAW
jgi:hypothetical protein